MLLSNSLAVFWKDEDRKPLNFEGCVRYNPKPHDGVITIVEYAPELKDNNVYYINVESISYISASITDTEVNDLLAKIKDWTAN